MTNETEKELHQKRLIIRTKNITLRYFLIEDSGNYGIKIACFNDDVYDENRAFPLANTKEEVTELLAVMAKNFVFPVSLFEILEEVT